MPSRLIHSDIGISDKIALLSPKSLSLFCLMLPHFNAHGKMNGEPHFVKGQICPKIKWLQIKDIIKCLTEITEKTNVKWFQSNGLYYIHSLNWNDHQPGLRKDRLGKDCIPSYAPRVVQEAPGVVPPEVEGDLEGEVEVEEEVEEEGSERPAAPSSTFPLLPDNLVSEHETDGITGNTGHRLATNGSGDLDPALKAILVECPHLALISTGASSTFWDQVLAICEPYPQAGPAWLNAKIRKWNQWFEDNKGRRSRKREFLQSRIMRWLESDLERLTMRKT